MSHREVLIILDKLCFKDSVLKVGVVSDNPLSLSLSSPITYSLNPYSLTPDYLLQWSCLSQEMGRGWEMGRD